MSEADMRLGAQVVDRLTPDGQVPAASQGLDLGALAGLAGDLFKR